MKKFIVILMTLLVVYAIYYDLTTGTLHSTSSNLSHKQLDTVTRSQGVVVEHGHTVLSIVEKLHEGTVPASIEDVVAHFKQLNNGINPEEIQAGKQYLFPIYQ